VIASDAIHAFGGERDAAEDVSTADDYAYFHSLLSYCGNFDREVLYTLWINTEGCRPGHGLAAQLQKDAIVFGQF
jgi:hypothetical protein